MILFDDEKIIREGLEMLVEWEQFDFEVVGVFEDGNSLIEYLIWNPVDVIITDIKMPNGTGLDVARYCHEKKTKERWHYDRQQFDDALNSFCGVVSKNTFFAFVN